MKCLWILVSASDTFEKLRICQKLIDHCGDLDKWKIWIFENDDFNLIFFKKVFFLHNWLINFKFLILISLKMIMDIARNGRWIIFNNIIRMHLISSVNRHLIKCALKWISMGQNRIKYFSLYGKYNVIKLT